MERKLLLVKYRNGFFWALNVGQSGVETLDVSYQNLVSKELLGVKILPQKGPKADWPFVNASRRNMDWVWFM